MQDSSLNDFITKKVYPFHPHYRSVFDEAGIDPASIKTVEDLQKLPPEDRARKLLDRRDQLISEGKLTLEPAAAPATAPADADKP